MGLQRHLKVAGIFARLTLRDGKPKYLADAPRFIRLHPRHGAHRYRELTPLLAAGGPDRRHAGGHRFRLWAGLRAKFFSPRQCCAVCY
jgi:hypothetical protein